MVTQVMQFESQTPNSYRLFTVFSDLLARSSLQMNRYNYRSSSIYVLHWPRRPDFIALGDYAVEVLLCLVASAIADGLDHVSLLGLFQIHLALTLVTVCLASMRGQWAITFVGALQVLVARSLGFLTFVDMEVLVAMTNGLRCPGSR